MELQRAQYGKRIRVNLPYAGDHGQLGTIMKVRGGKCYVHVDWDERPLHMVMFMPQDLDDIADTTAAKSSSANGTGLSDTAPTPLQREVV